MKHSISLCVVVIMSMLGGIEDVGATLIGDEVTITHRYWALDEGDVNYDITLRTFLVEEGGGDSWDTGSTPVSYTVNMESDVIYFEFFIENALYRKFNGGVDFFNGPVLFDLNDSSGGPLIDVIIDCNFGRTGDVWTDNRLSFTQDSISFNLGGLAFTNLTYLNASLVFDTAPVPEPFTMLLFGTGLVGLVGISIGGKKK